MIPIGGYRKLLLTADQIAEAERICEEVAAHEPGAIRSPEIRIIAEMVERRADGESA